MKSNYTIYAKLGLFFTVVILVIASLNQCRAQVYVNGIDINTLDIEYIEMVVTDMGMFKKNIVVSIDYGQKVKSGDQVIIADKDNKPVNFESNMGALNFLAKNGWEFVTAYLVSVPQAGSVYHYVLKRKY